MNMEEGRPLADGESSSGSLATPPRRKFNRFVAVGTAVVAVLVIGIGGYVAFRPAAESARVQKVQTPTARLSSGYDIPLLGMGTVAIRGDNGTAAVKAAIEMGYRHIDTAGNYGSEEFIGQALSELLSSGAIQREDVFITTKLETDRHAKESVEPALRESLANLQLDWVDLYLVHWPITDQPGPELNPPMKETWEGMEGVLDLGLTRTIGVSNFSPQKITQWFSDARTFPAVNQVEVHPNWRNDRVVDFDREHNIHTTAYMPLSSPGTMAAIGKEEPNLMHDPTIIAIAEANHKPAAQVLLRWGLQHGTSVIPKSSNPKHLQDNLGALGWELSEEDFNTISTFTYQDRYNSGLEWGYVSPEGPWHNLEELWNE